MLSIMQFLWRSSLYPLLISLLADVSFVRAKIIALRQNI